VPGSIVFRWYDRAQADEIYSTWTVRQTLARLEADKANPETALGKPDAAATESLERLLTDMRARGFEETPISQLPTERASDALLRYELMCDACTQAEWRANEAFLLRHLSELRVQAERGMSSMTALAPAELEEQYKASREGRFRWHEWAALHEAMGRLDWNRWDKMFRASYEADKTTRKGGVERALRDNYAAAEELRQRLQEGDEHGWALVVYNANDERLPFPAPPFLMAAMRQTEAEVDEARQAAEATMVRRRRLLRMMVVLIVLLALFLIVSLLFKQSLVGGIIGTALIIVIIAAAVYLNIRPQART
jgi:hypothetical protein